MRLTISKKGECATLHYMTDFAVGQIERIFDRIRKAKNGCWEWQGSIDADGYGQFWFQGRNHRAHRVTFFLNEGYWPSEVAHLCNNRKCVRPKHLRDMSHKANCAMIDSPHKKKTHCPRGHAYTPENTRYDRRGWRACKTCISEAQKALYVKRPRKRKIDRKMAKQLSKRYRSGETIASLASELGVSASLVSFRIREWEAAK